LPQCEVTERLIDVLGIKVEVLQQGSEPPLLFLHAHVGRDLQAPFFERLSRTWTVFAPSHPGFGRSELPRWMDTVDDLSLFYLGLLEALELTQLTVVGASFGAWIAAEMAVKSSERLSRLVLADPLGIRTSDPTTPDIYDIFTAAPRDIDAMLYRNPAMAARDLSALSEEQAFIMFRERESTALFGWSPYMNNPKLKHWLHRIRIPTLVVHGQHDGITSANYAASFAKLIPNASFVSIQEAGHLPHIEAPERLVEAIERFAQQTDSLAA
jgi:pimeloyl-ACP methyl ester carboxylesterase